MKTTNGYVYLIADVFNETYKIGVTRRKVEQRLKQLQTGNSNQLDLIDYYQTEYPYKLESMLHNRFKPQQANNEWYFLTKEDIDNFQDTCNHLNEIINVMKDSPFFWK